MYFIYYREQNLGMKGRRGVSEMRGGEVGLRRGFGEVVEVGLRLVVVFYWIKLMVVDVQQFLLFIQTMIGC